MTHDDAFLIERLIASFADTSPVKQLETHATKTCYMLMLRDIKLSLYFVKSKEI